MYKSYNGNYISVSDTFNHYQVYKHEQNDLFVYATPKFWIMTSIPQSHFNSSTWHENSAEIPFWTSVMPNNSQCPARLGSEQWYYWNGHIYIEHEFDGSSIIEPQFELFKEGENCKNTNAVYTKDIDCADLLNVSLADCLDFCKGHRLPINCRDTNWIDRDCHYAVWHRIGLHNSFYI